MPLDQQFKKPITSLIVLLSLGAVEQSYGCGGFFCDFVPINQAGEQIVFRQEGEQTTAMIKIDYVGNAEDFGWVLPVPNVPEITLGSDQIFTELELNTRPQFFLSREGNLCSRAEDFSNSSLVFQSSRASFASSSASQSVTIEQTLSIGAFDAQIISSDDPEDLALWLEENNLDLTDQGGSLLAPYIAAKSKFVVLKLKNNANVGSIQPVILKYKSSAPVIPMTLTAVAAQNNMGVLVWLLGDGRGVPNNFKHVTPNYTRLNWFSGTRSAYASYQTLITQAMDEAGGQGFATDFAGYSPNLAEQFTTAEIWQSLIAEGASVSDASFVEQFWLQGSAVIQSAIRDALPTSDSFVYSRPLIMDELFTAEQLSAARDSITQVVEEQIIAPLNNSIDILDDDLYLTRMYTTLSANEMTMNPEFTFNPAMEDQSLSRNAKLTSSCVDGQNHWTLKLGAGTGREDELVLESWGYGTPFGPAINSDDQAAVWRVQKTSATSDPVTLSKNDFPVLVQGFRSAVSSYSSIPTSSSNPTNSSMTSSSSSFLSSSTNATGGSGSSSGVAASANSGSKRGGSFSGGIGYGLLGLLFAFAGFKNGRKRNIT